SPKSWRLAPPRPMSPRAACFATRTQTTMPAISTLRRRLSKALSEPKTGLKACAPSANAARRASVAAKSFPEMTWWRLSIYALPGVPMAFWYVPLTALLPAFYAEHVGVGLAAMGGFLLISRLFDIFLDPVLGRWCDNTKTRFGRRRPWIVLGAPICMLGVWLLLMPPEGANGWYLLMATMTI